MIIKSLTIAAAVGMVSTAAFAQEIASPPSSSDSSTSATSPNTVNPMPEDQAPTSLNTPAPTGVSSDVVAISPDEARARGIPVQVTASAPVPDTPANRAKFGGPMSHAGKMTRPAGN